MERSMESMWKVWNLYRKCMEFMWKSVESMCKMYKRYGIHVEKCEIHVVVIEQNHSIWIPLECGGRVKCCVLHTDHASTGIGRPP